MIHFYISYIRSVLADKVIAAKDEVSELSWIEGIQGVRSLEG